MDALIYENFIKKAFETKKRYDSQDWKSDRLSVDRGEDPAGLAEAGLFNTQSLSSKVKVAIAYSMEVYSNLFKNDPSIGSQLTNGEYSRMNSIIDDVLNARNHNDLIKLIREYRVSFIDLYLPKLQ